MVLRFPYHSPKRWKAAEFSSAAVTSPEDGVASPISVHYHAAPSVDISMSLEKVRCVRSRLSCFIRRLRVMLCVICQMATLAPSSEIVVATVFWRVVKVPYSKNYFCHIATLKSPKFGLYEVGDFSSFIVSTAAVGRSAIRIRWASLAAIFGSSQNSFSDLRPIGRVA
jgi:hypothetical protein